MTNGTNYEAALAHSMFVRKECEQMMVNGEPKKAYVLYLTDELGTKADFETFVASYRDQVGEHNGL